MYEEIKKKPPETEASCKWLAIIEYIRELPYEQTSYGDTNSKAAICGSPCLRTHK